MKITIDVPEKYIKKMAAIAALIDSEDEVTEEQKKAFLETKEMDLDLESVIDKEKCAEMYFAIASFAFAKILGIRQ